MGKPSGVMGMMGAPLVDVSVRSKRSRRLRESTSSAAPLAAMYGTSATARLADWDALVAPPSLATLLYYVSVYNNRR
ncbi:MAG: hypothetical protein EOO65_04265 [Methanosarcinales archaeon]|nr:MAG: hypothetical protein EOO65_04265 [Methanosarcinales archaeon]